jgi:putative inorganic carbon (hco3(-)) transporter
MMWIIIAAICIVIGWGLFDPFVGLLGLVAVNIVQPGELYPLLDAFHVERVMAVLVLVSLLVHRKNLAFPDISKLFFIFWLTMFLSIPFAFWRMGAFESTLDFSRIVIYHILVVNLVTTPRRFRIFLTVFVLLTGWLAASSYISFLGGGYYLESGHFARAEGISSSGGNPNELGLSLVCALPLVVVLALRKSWRYRVIGIGVALISLYAIVFTGSRMAFISLIFVLAAYTFSAGKRLVFLPVAIALLAIIWQVMPPEYQQRYLSVRSLKDDDSYQNRVLAWHAGWHMFLDYPLTGVGVGQFPIADGTKYWPNSEERIWLNAHSLYLQLLAELGLFGVFAFGAYLYSLFRLNYRLRKELSVFPGVPPWLRFYPTACSLSLLVLLFAGYSSHDLYRSNWYMLGALSGCVQMFVNKERVKLRRAKKTVQVAEPAIVAYPVTGDVQV